MCAWTRESSTCYVSIFFKFFSGSLSNFTSQGDSGGPLLMPNMDNGMVQVGITSWGYECGSEITPSVFASVRHAYDWIMNQVETAMTASSTTSPSPLPSSLPTSFPSNVPSLISSSSPTHDGKGKKKKKKKKEKKGKGAKRS